MTPWHAHAVCAERSHRPTPPSQRVLALSAVILVLGIVAGAIGFYGASAPDTVRYASGGPDPAETSWSAGRTPVGSARLPVDIAPAVQAPGRVTNVGLAEPVPNDWDLKDLADKNNQFIRTIDAASGGKLNFNPKTGRLRVCDAEEDNHAVHGHAYRNMTEVAFVRDGGKDDDCDEISIPGYSKKTKYGFRVCLLKKGSDHEGYCNSSDSGVWPKASKKEECPEPQPVGSPCKGKNLNPSQNPNVPEGGVLNIPKGGNGPSIHDRPDARLTGHAEVSAVTDPVKTMLRWLIWAVLAACVAGIVFVGGDMAIKHKRGQAGAHAAQLGWVMVACVVAGSGLALAFITLLKPL